MWLHKILSILRDDFSKINFGSSLQIHKNNSTEQLKYIQVSFTILCLGRLDTFSSDYLPFFFFSNFLLEIIIDS